MVLRCLTWIPHLWKQLCIPFAIESKQEIRPLPDDAIVEILSRLPIDDVLKCRMVCRNWRALTLKHHFAEAHVSHAPSTVLVQHREEWACTKKPFDLFILEEDTKSTVLVNRVFNGSIQKLQQAHPMLKSSCNGLLLFDGLLSPSSFIICNPVTQESLTMKTPTLGGFICGFFFHLSKNDYQLLYVHQTGNGAGFMICSLGKKSWRQLRVFDYMPRRSSIALVSGEYLYWMADHDSSNGCDNPCTSFIITFNTSTEKFSVMPHPGEECKSQRSHEKIHLLLMEGKLSFCLLHSKQIHIWVLRDHQKKGWEEMYQVDPSWDVMHYPYVFGPQTTDDYDIRPLNFQNNKLLLFWPNRGLFLYNLEVNTIRKIQLPELQLFRVSSRELFLISYKKSLVSPTAFLKGQM